MTAFGLELTGLILIFFSASMAEDRAAPFASLAALTASATSFSSGRKRSCVGALKSGRLGSLPLAAASSAAPQS